MFIDSHAHLNDERLLNSVQQILDEAKQQSVDIIICASYNTQSSICSTELANKFEGVYSIIGVHPHDAKEYNDEVEKKFIELSKNKKVLAIGEIGLDYYYDLSPRDVQKQVFEKQIDLAYRLNLPIVVHTRDAIGDTLEILKQNKHKIKKALIHCFNASNEVLKQIMDWGYYVSYGGAITFKNANGLLECVKNTPIDRILLETDCPYMTPVPYRGKENYPKYITLVAQKLAEIKNITVQEVEKFTTQNAKKFFEVD